MEKWESSLIIVGTTVVVLIGLCLLGWYMKLWNKIKECFGRCTGKESSGLEQPNVQSQGNCVSYTLSEVSNGTSNQRGILTLSQCDIYEGGLNDFQNINDKFCNGIKQSINDNSDELKKMNNEHYKIEDGHLEQIEILFKNEFLNIGNNNG